MVDVNPSDLSKEIECHPVSEERWKDLEQLLGDRGGWQGCWCMRWRLTRARFVSQRGAPNRRALRQEIGAGHCTGVVAYRDSEPVAWCSVGPRENYPVLETSDLLARIDDRAVWSITCVFVAKRARRQGITVPLIQGAVAFAAQNHAEVVEAYPVIPLTPHMPVAAALTGIYSAFQKAGFSEVLRRVDIRPIMRYEITPAERHHDASSKLPP